MTTVGSDEPLPAAPVPRRGPPRWGIALFLGLLAVLVLINYLVSSSGPPVRWIENDPNAALAQAAAANKRVFLYVYEPNDPTHARNEREVFSMRWARESLSRAIACRLAVGRGDLARVKYGYRDRPLFLVLDAAGRERNRTEGAPDERQFLTQVTMYLDQKN